MAEGDSKQRVMAWRIFVLAATLVAFFPVVTHDFGGWDDEQNLVSNPDLNPPSWSGLGRYWRAPTGDLYVPVTWTCWSVLARVAYLPESDPNGARLNPYVFHTANLVVHLAVVWLVFELMRRLFPSSTAAAAAGALVFAVHPVQVEAVAWISGFKDVLSGALAIAAIFAVLRCDDQSSRRRGYYLVATLLFVLALLAKPSAIVVPVIVVVLDTLVKHRPLSRVLLSLWPWFVIALVFSLVTRRYQPADFIGDEVGWWKRPAIALDALSFYLFKLVWPVTLGVDYGRTPQRVLSSAVTLLTMLVPLVLAGVLIAVRRRFPEILAGAMIFVAALLPVLGLLPFDFQAYSTVADHYLYLAMLGPALVVTWAAARFGQLLPVRVAAIVIVLLLGLMSLSQARTWHDAGTIAQQALKVNPRSFAWNDRAATILIGQNSPAEALRFAEAAIAAEPRFANAWLNRGIILSMLGRYREAAGSLSRALELRPNDAAARVALGNALAELGDTSGAIAQYDEALKLNPHDAAALSNLAAALAAEGKLPEAIELYERAIAIQPNLQAAQVGLQRARAAIRSQSTTHPAG